ncbi:MAG: RNA polymerase sigma factor [Clostridiaceae bacterium]|nr:RNA polymerase sigma factor [Clostridiaceae bacterium]
MKKTLIKKIKNNDIDAFVDWLDHRKNKYYKIAWAYVHNHHDVEDVFQITIMKVYENIHQLKEEKYFETWVTSIFLNECRNIVRKQKRETVVGDSEVIESSYQESFSIELKEELNRLEDIHKEAILLKYINGYSQEEIAEILQVPIGTVKSRIYRGLKLLKEVMNKEV